MGRALGTALASLLALSACSAVVGAPIDPGEPLACEIIDGFDPCPARSECVDGYCNISFDVCNGVDDNANGLIDEGSAIAPPCEGGARCVRGMCLTGCTAERCNRMDDDCDGAADQGLDVDADGDGVSACPSLGEPDCDDANSSVFPESGITGAPAAPEICNGLDDDCDPATTEDTLGVCSGGAVCQRLPGAISPICLPLTDCRLTGCTAPSVCDSVTYSCSMPPVDCRTSSCPSPLVCNMASGMCERPPLAAIGDTCQNDSDCDSGLCVPRAALALAAGPGLGICGSACCSNADCNPGAHCWAPGTGARSCVTADVYGDASAQLCSLPTHCPGGTCRVGSVTYTAMGMSGGFDAVLCSGPLGGGASQICPDIIGRPTCRNGTCLTGYDICANPCERTEDCAPQYTDLVLGFYDLICGYVGDGTGEIYTGCVPTSSAGTGTSASLSTCARNDDCRDGLCSSNRCADICCSDRNCPADYRCAPTQQMIRISDTETREIWPMRCFPRGRP